MTRLIDARVALSIVLSALVLTGCGGEDTPKDTADTAGTVADGASTADTTVDAGSGGVDTLVVPDTGKPKDTAKAKMACGEMLSCTLGCLLGDAGKACRDACTADPEAGALDKLKAWQGCGVPLCDAATNTQAVEACQLDNCYDELGACADLGGGDADCTAATSCAASCSAGDVRCTIQCFETAAKDDLAATRDLRLCALKACAGLKDDAKSACIAANCATEIDTCRGETAFDCLQLSSCNARCATPKPGEFNDCGAFCTSFASDDGVALSGAYADCKLQCKGLLDSIGCVKEKCVDEVVACFGEGGDLTCQEINTCVSDECSGIGGDPVCISACLAKGKAGSKDAFIQYEGCLLGALTTEDAEKLGCTFPYDKSTCLPTIEGQYCGPMTTLCFSEQ